MRVTAYTEEYFGKHLISEKIRDLVFDGDQVIEQLNTSVGVPDAIVVKKDLASFFVQFLNQKTKLTKDSKYIRVLSALNRIPHTLAFLCKKTGLSYEVVRRYVSKLEALGIVTTSGNVKVSFSKDIAFPKLEITSVEFKLSNWQSALRQAIKYKTFSSAVYVVMPYEKLSLLKKYASIFRENGVGLAVFDLYSKELKIISQPRRPRTSPKYYANALMNIYSRLQ